MTIEEVGANPRKLAKAIFDQLAGLAPPIPVHDIARALDIAEIRVVELDGLEGCLLTDQNKDRGAILVNAASGARRVRYTIGHELGHFLNPWHWPVEEGGFLCSRHDMVAPRGAETHRRQEREANTFSIELLTPRSMLRPHLSPEADLRHVVAMADRFDISKEAAARRYVELHDERIAIVFAVDDRIRYVARSEGFPRLARWMGDPVIEMPQRPSDASGLSGLDEVNANLWLAHPGGIELYAQALYQSEQYAMVMLVCEAADEE